MARPLQPEAIIGSWPEWGAGLRSRPVLLSELGGGRSNRSYLLDSDIGKLVLRINGAGSLLPGTSGGNELRIWREASKQGIAPALLFVDAENRFLVSSHVKNELPPDPQLNPACIEQAFSLLDRTHKLDINAPEINYSDHVEHYWRIIETGDKTPSPTLIQQREQMQSLLASLLASRTPTGLCHHDPVKANFVGSPERLYLVDWEYAAKGLQIMDYAALATEWQLDDATVLEHKRFNPGLLASARRLYQYLCLLWEEAMGAVSTGKNLGPG